MTEHWSSARIRLTAAIDNSQYEVVQFAASWELNTIPSAILTFAVGRDIRTLQAAKAHRSFKDIANGQQVKVYLQVEPLAKSGDAFNDWPQNKFLIFEGGVKGVGWRRSGKEAGFTLHADHWLSKLNYSSSFSGSSHPGNPADFTYAAGFRPANVKAAGGSTQLDWVPHLAIQEKGINRTDLEKDLWEEVLKKWMTQLSQQDPIDDRLNDATSNKSALFALDRMVSRNMAMKFDSALDGTALGNAVSQALSHAVGRADMNNTLWGKLVGEWASSYFFMVAPRVQDTIVAPFTGGLRGDPWRTISINDYVQCDLSNPMPHRLRCVGIAHPTTFEAGGNTNLAETKVIRRGLGGLYLTQRQNKEGLVLVKQAPHWLNPSQGLKFGQIAAGVVPRVPIRTLATKDDVGPQLQPNNPPGDNQKQMKPILDQLAQQWFILESLKGNTGELSGRLRFDIAPGSQVQVEGGRDPFVAADGGDQLGEPFFAAVSRVSYLLNAELQRAGTSFTLSHIRNLAENNLGDTSIDKPPLYREGWRGDVLLDPHAAPGP